MVQKLVDLYEVEFKEYIPSQYGNGYMLRHSSIDDSVIHIGNRKNIIVGEPYLKPLSKYGGGFLKKTLIGKSCCWLGSGIASKVGDDNTSKPIGTPYRMVEVPVSELTTKEGKGYVPGRKH